MSEAPATRRRFRYTARTLAGDRIADSIAAPDRVTALRQLARADLVVIDIAETGTGTGTRRSAALHAQRLLIMRQFAVMLRARVELLEAIESIASGLADRTLRDGLREIAAGLRRGDRLAKAFATGLPGFPDHIYALLEAGETTGRLDRVIDEAVSELAVEARVARELRTALAYPLFLMGAGLLVILFMFLIVVPRFAAMIGSRRDSLEGLPAFVLGIGEAAQAHGLGILLAAILLGIGGHALGFSAAGKRMLLPLIERLPILSGLVAARQCASWARIMAFAIGAGVGLLEASTLALAALPDGRFRAALAHAARGFRAGKTVADALAETGAIGAMDVSLLRAGQRSGALAEMFGLIADYHQERLHEALKRASMVVEQLAIILVAAAIGTIVLSLVSAMTSVYEAVQ
ncbi:hypothetical protein CLG96_08230 [Sphingomonas oleivorans]|uniref:Type II secretion system protein GspF domain-containing protein n=1 Tax=Sphingomonas oleivorans TaxID=1735121 RepID=A0A2T5FY14_9SPHN|nr:type II secretion system F family protein [Sphingomonas oleivorans]PTQ11428.1 hypothetical protein CLG96_08230 [Sphingomonas oleivorans]